jgi:hypothetical protein
MATAHRLILFFLLTACGGSHHFRSTNSAATPGTAPYLELRADHAVDTLHFPSGLYILDAVDDKGYYYRAPRKIMQHSFGRSLFHNGGIFVSKRDPNKLRGYVILTTGLTHVGNLSRVPHEFRWSNGVLE